MPSPGEGLDPSAAPHHFAASNLPPLSAAVPPGSAGAASSAGSSRVGGSRAGEPGTQQKLPPPQIEALLDAVVSSGASDLHLSVGMKPRLRLHGGFQELNTRVMTESDIESLVRMTASANERNLQILHEQGSVDLAISHGNKARFRVNIFVHQGGRAIVMRRLPEKIMSIEEIGLPLQLRELMHRPRGLILITGPTGSGKTTTLAALVNEIIQTSEKHVITLEQPIEYMFRHGMGIIHQREIPTHAKSFSDGLKYALREDPDVIVVGEMRELETMKTALSAAETGHIVLATLHTSSAAKTVDRIIDAFPEDEKENIRVQLSTALLGVLCQQLATRADGKGLVAAYEFLSMNNAIANLIRDKKSFQIDSAIQTGKVDGMRLLDDHLYELAKKGTITRAEALSLANKPRDLMGRLPGRAEG